MNLLNQRKVISIEIEIKKKFVLINIEDNGDGFLAVEKNYLNHILPINLMELVWGLQYVKIVEDHSGEISLLDSSSLGGARVAVKLFKNIGKN